MYTLVTIVNVYLSPLISFFFLFSSLLAHLRDKELSAAPFNVKNPSHRQIILEEIQEIKALKVKLPQNLWEYKVCLVFYW